MTEFSKLASSLLLVGAGFFAASLLGPPDLMDRLAQRFRPASGQSTSWLQPIATAEPSGPPLRDPTQSVRPLPPLPQTVPAVSAIGVSHPADQTAGGAAATSDANDWFNNADDSGWPAASTATQGAGTQIQAQPQPLPNSQPWPAAQAKAEPKDPWGEPWPTSPAPVSGGTANQQPYAAAKPIAEAPRPRPTAPLGTHIVTDGDTLPRLAERYLGDPSRASELFALNEDRLDSPDLLPIGVVLRVPDEPLAQQATLTPPSASRLPTSPADQPPGSLGTPLPTANQYTAVGFTDGPNLFGAPPQQAASPPAARQEHRASRLVPVGDPAEAAAPVPVIQQSTGPAYTPRTIDEWQW